MSEAKCLHLCVALCYLVGTECAFTVASLPHIHTQPHSSCMRGVQLTTRSSLGFGVLPKDTTDCAWGQTAKISICGQPL